MVRTILLPCVLAACATFPAVASAQSKVAASNWNKGARLDSVRAVVKWVDGLSPTLTEQTDSSSCDEGHVVLVSRLFADSRACRS